MKVLVCGSRSFSDYEHARRVLFDMQPTQLIHGCARGADALAERFGQEVSIPMDRYPALWNTFGKRAGILRNEQMLREGCPDTVVAFWDGQSKGTGHMISIAEKAGVPVKVINI